MRQVFSLILFFLAGAVAAFGQITTVEYYVSDTGDDANSGTETAPFRTVQKCVDQFDDVRQVICNCEGTFNEEIDVSAAGGPSPEKRSKIIAWDTDGDGDRTDETFVIDGEGIRNQAIISDFGGFPDNIELGWITFRNYDPDGGCNSVDDGELHFIKLRCWGGGCADWWIHDNVFEKLGKECNVGSHYIAIQPSDTPRLVVENNRFDSIGGFIMRYVGGTGIVFRNNYVKVHLTGIKAWDDPDSIQIVGNIFECDGNGINAPDDTRCGGQNAINLSNNVTGSQIKDNIFLDCVTAINIGTDNRAGLKNNGPHLIEGNRIYQSGRICRPYIAAIQLDDCSDTTIRGDSIHVFDVTIRNNVIAWTDTATSSLGTALKLTAGHPFPFRNNVRFLNNTVHGFRQGVLMDICYLGGLPAEFQLKGVTIRNNIFSEINDELFTLGRNIGTWPDSSLALEWDSDYNLFSGRDRINWGSIRYTLEEWQNARGHDLHSRFASPEFVADINSSQPLFELAADDTLAQNRGGGLADVREDFSGSFRPMGGAWDIGAHELPGKRIFFAHATAGDDANLGSIDQPFASLQKAINDWDGLHQYELRAAGTFNEELSITHGGPAADSMNTITAWDTDGDGSLNDENLTLDGQNTRTIALRTDTATSPDYVEITNLNFHRYAPSFCDEGQESRFIRLKGSQADPITGWKIHNNSFSNLAFACNLTTKQSAIRASWVERLLVENNRFDSISGYLLNSIRGSRVDFRGNVATVHGGGVRTMYSVDSLRIVDNRFVGDGNGNGAGSDCKQQWGVNLINGIQGALVSGNEFIGTSGGVRLSLNEKGDRHSSGNIIEKNLIVLNDEACNAKRPGIMLNDVSGISEAGDSLWIEDVLVRNNVIVFDGDIDQSNGAIKLIAGHAYPFANNWRFYNNTIDGFRRGMVVLAGADSEGIVYGHLLNGVESKNNLFSGIGDAHYKFEWNIWTDSLPTGWDSDYNVYGGLNQFRWQGRKSLSNWQTKTGEDLHSVVCDAVYDANDSLYHLSSLDHCAVDRGVSLLEVIDDIDGESRPSGSGYDVGADERAGGGLARMSIRANGSPGGEIADERLSITPHPVSGTAVVSLQLREGGRVEVIKLYDMQMRLVKSWEVEEEFASDMHEIACDMSELSSGSYMLVVEIEGRESRSGRVVIHR